MKAASPLLGVSFSSAYVIIATKVFWVCFFTHNTGSFSIIPLIMQPPNTFNMKPFEILFLISLSVSALSLRLSLLFFIPFSLEVILYLKIYFYRESILAVSFKTHILIRINVLLFGVKKNI